MRRVRRSALPPPTQAALDGKQTAANLAQAAGTLDLDKTWNSARKSKPLKTALAALRTMAGERQRCMYCGDSHGTDIEHFWPKKPHPDRMFRWLNLLLCCAECGRFTGDRFALDTVGAPLLIDPTADNPWDYLDFNPDTNTFVARFDPDGNAQFPKGLETVAALQLDRREALEAGYRKTHRRIVAAVDSAVQQALPDAPSLCEALREADDHGLLGWYLGGTGQSLPPFSELRARHPDVWDACVLALN